MRKPLQNRLDLVRELLRPPKDRNPYRVVFEDVDGSLVVDGRSVTPGEVDELEADPDVTVIRFVPTPDPA